ncbi:MAG TPA: response regulator [Blastocatellia bacterium]|nr:response regulator [Blastocatellia bacterium]
MVSRILLADDSITIQKVVNLTFADEGIDVVAVSNGEMAARRMDEVNPDLVLADIFMPGKNGYELCETIKNNSKFRNIPVVLLVGAFEPFDQAEARRVQADAHLTKPFESRTLVETVRRLLAKSERPRTAPLPPIASTEQEIPVAADWMEPTPLEEAVSLDFESESGEWAPVDAAALPQHAANGETMPLDLGQASLGDSLSFEPVVETAGEQADLEVPLWERPTGELVSPPGYDQDSTEAAQETHASTVALPSASGHVAASSNSFAEQPGLELETQTWPDESHSVPVTSSDEPLETHGLEIETQVLTEKPQPPVEYQQQQMVVDFDESLRTNTAANSDTEKHDATPPVVYLVGQQAQDAVEWRVEEVEQAASEWRAANSINLNTTTLEPLDSSLVSSAAAETIAESSTTEAPAPQEASTLFAAEEPLGDVLSDTAGDLLPSEASKSEGPLAETAVTDFSLELPTEELQAVTDVPEPQMTSNRVTGELVTADLPMEGQQLVEAASRDFVVAEVSEPVSDLQQALQPEALSDPSHESVSTQPAIDDSASYDWTSPSAVSHSTEQLDSMVVPAHFMASSAEDAHHEPESIETAAVETAAVADPLVEFGNRESEELRFAAIDVDASPIEEPSAESLDPSDPEKGFEFSRALVDDLESADNENGYREASLTPSGPVELSPMVIDEIVRRVVAQIGDSIVREIAWEIVPDCVERIIDQQTRAALSKR